MGMDSKAVLKPRTPDASRDLWVQRVSRQRVECGASAPLSKGVQSLCKAFLEGVEEIDAVQLPTMPKFRWRLLPNGEEVEVGHGDAAR